MIKFKIQVFAIAKKAQKKKKCTVSIWSNLEIHPEKVMEAKEARGIHQEIPAHRNENLKPDFAVKYYVPAGI